VMSFVPEGWEVVEQPKSKKESFDPSEWEVISPGTPEEPESRIKSATRAIAQPILGWAAKYTYPLDLLSLAATGESLGEFEELQERLPELQQKFPDMGVPSELDQEKFMEALQTAQETFPTQHNIESLIERTTGAPLSPKSTLDKMLRLGGMGAGFQPGSMGQKAISGTAAPLISQGAQTFGIPESLADILGLGASSLRLQPGATKAAAEELAQPAVKETFTSGIEKPRAVESRHLKKGRITPQQEAEAIERLNTQAAEITKKKYHEKHPIGKQIEEGFDFYEKFDKDFNQLEKMTKKENIPINIDPVSKFLEETFEKYHGVVSPPEDAKYILKEAEAFAKNPQAGLHNLLKNYRSYNSKYIDVIDRPNARKWLEDMNKAISKSMENTLTEKSPIMQLFKSSNAEYAAFKKATEAKKLLEPLLGGELSAARLKNISENAKTQSRLHRSMGNETADELIQLSKDLKKATEAINKIPKKEFSKMEALFSAGSVLNGGIFAGLHGAFKGKEAAQRAFGYMLLNAKTRKNYGNVLKALAKGDPKSYEQALKTLVKSMKADLV